MIKKLLVLFLMLMAINIPMSQAQLANNSRHGAIESSARNDVPYETPAPTWTYEFDGEVVIFTATGEGTVTLYIQYIDNWTGEMTTESYTDEGTVTAVVPCAEEETYVNVWASAQANEDAIPGVTGIEYYIVIPALLPVPEVTESPVITYEDTGDHIVVTATGNGQIYLYCEGMLVADGYGCAIWSIPYGDNPDSEMYTIMAIAQEDGKEVSDAVVITVYVPGMPPGPYETPAPTWTYVIDDDAVVFTATGEGDVTLYIQYIDNWTGEMTTEYYTGIGVVTVAVPRAEEETYVNVWASAQANEDAIPGITGIEYYIVIPALPMVPEVTESPVITYEDTGDGVTVTATGNGHICLYWEDTLVADGYGCVIWNIPYSDNPDGEMYTIIATAQEDGKEVSTAIVITVFVPCLPPTPYETPAPVWTYVVDDDAVVFTATGEGTVTLYIQYIDNWTGEMTTESYTGDGVITVAVPRAEEETYVNVWASAQANEYAIPGFTGVEYYIVIPARPLIPPVLMGDADGDGEVTITDVAVVIDYLLSDDASYIYLENADFNHDGDVNINDVSAIIDYLLYMVN